MCYMSFDLFRDGTNCFNDVTNIAGSWLVPLIDNLAYESLLVFNKHEMILNGENVSYKSIRDVKLMDKQKKCKIVIRAKGKEYLYKTNEKNSQKVFDYLNKVCPRIDHREKL